jgi:ABC-type antimicrobial peptide transport system permease subunit
MAIPFRYNLRSLLVRRVSTAMTAGGIALVAIVSQALVFAALIGVAGGFFPARQAMKLSVVDALRRT